MPVGSSISLLLYAAEVRDSFCSLIVSGLGGVATSLRFIDLLYTQEDLVSLGRKLIIYLKNKQLLL